MLRVFQCDGYRRNRDGCPVLHILLPRRLSKEPSNFNISFRWVTHYLHSHYEPDRSLRKHSRTQNHSGGLGLTARQLFGTAGTIL
jgi:hypothetical protein